MEKDSRKKFKKSKNNSFSDAGSGKKHVRQDKS